MNLKKLRLAVIGLGYVGLPLAVEFSKKRKVIGYDVSLTRISELNSGFDKTLEINNGKFKPNKNLDIVNKTENIIYEKYKGIILEPGSSIIEGLTHNPKLKILAIKSKKGNLQVL